MTTSADIRARLERPVINMSKVVEEAYELVDEGNLTEKKFWSFMFKNAVQLHTAPNCDPFKGTTVEFDARKFNG